MSCDRGHSTARHDVARLHRDDRLPRIQLFLHPGPHPLLQIDGIRLYREGLPIGLEVALRIYCIVLASLLTFIWMDPTALTLLLLKTGLNYRYAMLVGLSLRTFPLLERELGKIYDSQQARGMELRGTLRKLIRLLPVMMPFVLRALRRARLDGIARLRLPQGADLAAHHRAWILGSDPPGRAGRRHGRLRGLALHQSRLVRVTG